MNRCFVNTFFARIFYKLTMLYEFAVKRVIKLLSVRDNG